jgi:hypothetical protein
MAGGGWVGQMGGGSQEAGLIKDELHWWASLEVRDGRWLPGSGPQACWLHSLLKGVCLHHLLRLVFES